MPAIGLSQGCINFSKMSKSHLKILDSRRLISSRFLTGDPNILGATIQNEIAWVTWHLGFVHAWSKCHFYDALCNIITWVLACGSEDVGLL